MKWAGDRKQESISPLYISLSEHLGIGLLSDRSSLLPLHWLTVPTRGEFSAPTSTTFPLCKWFPCRKAPRLVPINSVRPPVWIQAFFSLLHPPLPPSILLKRRSISDAKHWCSHCFGEGIERALTQSIYTTPFEEYAFFFYGEKWNYTNVWGIPAVKSKMHSYRHWVV